MNEWLCLSFVQGGSHATQSSKNLKSLLVFYRQLSLSPLPLPFSVTEALPVFAKWVIYFMGCINSWVITVAIRGLKISLMVFDTNFNRTLNDFTELVTDDFTTYDYVR